MLLGLSNVVGAAGRAAGARRWPGACAPSGRWSLAVGAFYARRAGRASLLAPATGDPALGRAVRRRAGRRVRAGAHADRAAQPHAAGRRAARRRRPVPGLPGRRGRARWCSARCTTSPAAGPGRSLLLVVLLLPMTLVRLGRRAATPSSTCDAPVPVPDGLSRSRRDSTPAAGSRTPQRRVTGRCSKPRRVCRSRRSGGPATRSRGNRSVSMRSAITASSRARPAPRQ